MERRGHLKDVVKFARKEYKEKRPVSVKVLRIKAKSILTRGLLPSLNIKQLGRAQFIVVADYGKQIRAYFFSKTAYLIGGENLGKNTEEYQKIIKGTKKEYTFPKEKDKTTINDITKSYRKILNRNLAKINQEFGLNVNSPFVVETDTQISLKKERTFGIKYANNKILKISAKLYKKKLLYFVLYREIFFFLINEKLSTNLLEKEKSFAYYDLSLFLTNLYLRNRYSDLVLKILKTDQDLVLQFEVKNINLTKKLINALEYQKESFTRTKTSNFLKNISQIFSVISKYDIKLEKIELSNLSIVLYEDFQSKNKLFLSFDKNLSYRFLLDIFVRSYENLNLLKKNKELIEKKDLFLILIFTILSRKSLREMPKFISLADNSHRLINMFQTFLNDDFIRSQIKKINDLSEHALLKYIFHYLIHINYDIMSEEKKLKLNLIIKSKGNVVLRNFSYRLDWKPHKRVKLTQKEDISKALDLHKKLEREYLFSTGQKGKVTFFCKVKFQNPLKRGNEMLKKRIKLGMINIEKKKK